MFGGIALQLGTGYTVAYLVYQIGTFIAEGNFGTGFVPGLVALALMVLAVVYLIAKSNNDLKNENAMKPKEKAKVRSH